MYCKDGYLIIEDNFMFEKINVKSFDDIIIFNEYPTQKYKIFIFLTNPVQRTEKEKNSVPGTKLIYSQDRFSLTDVFRKHKMMK